MMTAVRSPAAFVRSLMVVMLTVAISPQFVGDAAGEEIYRLGARDKLKIRINEWRPAKGEVHHWESLTGDYVVGASGSVAVPLVGEVKAVGLTTAELASAISDRLRQSAGLLQTPSTTVEILDHRPFFITGHVARPGEFPYRPGLTVIQAVSIAGGLYRSADPGILRFGREALVSRGDIRMLEVERIALVARRARLQSEIERRPEILFPEDIAKGMDGAIESILKEEREIFRTRQASLESQIAALRQTQQLYRREVDVLREKTVALDRQLNLGRRELESVSDLVSRGLAVSTRRLALEQNTAQYESQKLDTSLALLRANQEISRTDRQVIDLQTLRRTESLDQLREAQTRIGSLSERIDTAQKLVFEAEILAPQAMLGRMFEQLPQARFFIQRRQIDAITTEAVQETDFVLPGDVVKVERPSPPPLSPSEGSPLQPLLVR
ncbi:MAG: polysaccharide biosynthesis/export family protein [Beijerinckiaceae bacterium]